MIGSTKRADINDAGWSVVSLFFRYSLNLPVVIIYAWVLGPAVLGALKLIQLIVDYSRLSDLGLSKALRRQTPILAASGELDEIDKNRNVVITWGLLSTLTVILGLYTAYLLGWRLEGMLSGDIFLLMLILIIAARLQTFYSQILTADGHFILYSKIGMVMCVLQPVMTLGLVVLLGLGGVILSLIMGNMIYVVLIKHRMPFRISPSLDFKISKKLITVGFPLLLCNIGGKMLWSMEIMLVPIFLDLQQLGIFAFAIGAIKISKTLESSLGVLIFRNMALERGAKGEIERDYLIRYIRSPMAFYAVISAWATGSSYLVYRLITQLFLTEFRDSVQIILMLGFGNMIYQSRIVTSYVLNLLSRFRTLICIQVSVALFNLLIDIYLIQLYGLSGAVFGALLSFVVGGLIYIVITWQHLYDRGLFKAAMYSAKLILAASMSWIFLYIIPNRFDLWLSTNGNEFEHDWQMYLMQGLALLILLTSYSIWCFSVYCFVFQKEKLYSFSKNNLNKLIKNAQQFLIK